MPKGDMSRYQLSQLLIVYVNLGADILDVFSTFKKSTEVNKNRNLLIVVLCLFSLALMRFPLALTKKYHPKTQGQSNHKALSLCCSEIRSQHFPEEFLIYRLYLIITENVLNQMIFFTCKNMLIVMLGLYRFGVVCFVTRLGGENESGHQRNK